MNIPAVLSCVQRITSLRSLLLFLFIADKKIHIIKLNYKWMNKTYDAPSLIITIPDVLVRLHSDYKHVYFF